MRQFLKSFAIAAVILVGAVFAAGIGFKQDMALGAPGLGLPVYTMLFPLIWLAVVVWVNALISIVKYAADNYMRCRYRMAK